jgi:pseudaminic acid synthase
MNIKFKFPKTSCFVVAEVSANHIQNFNRALKMIRKAKECGADAVKFQAYTPDTLTLDVDNRYFRIKHPKWGGQTLYQLYQKAYTPWSWFRKLKQAADDLGITFFATAFDQSAVDFLEGLRVPFHKIASFELTDLPLIEYAAKTKKPLILSTGMASLAEIQEAVKVAKNAGAREVILLKCVSSYPAKPEEMNLRIIPDLAKRFHCPVGLSDHTLGIEISTAAVCLGARVIEKHFTLSKKIKGPDSFFSIEPQELKTLVKNIRTVEKALGSVHYGFTQEEKKNRIFRRSLFIAKDMHRDEIFTEKNLRSVRPGFGLSPKYLKQVIGSKASKNIAKGMPLSWNMVKD